MSRLRNSLLACAAALSFAAAAAWGAVAINDLQVTNVGTTTFTVVWTTSEVSTPGLEVFSDSGGANPVTATLGLDYFPITSGDPAVVNDRSARDGRRGLELLAINRRVVSVQVTGLAPGTVYFVRPRTFGPDGTDNGSGPVPLRSVTTAQFSSLISDGRLVRIRFSAFAAEGMIALVQGPAGTAPLSSIIGDSAAADSVMFPLASLIDTTTGTNALYSAPQPIVIRVLGLGAPAATFTKTINFGPAFNMAKYELIEADVSSPSPFFTTQPLNRTAQEGTGTTLVAVATGTPTPAYRWQRKPAGTAVWSDLTASAPYAGVATGTLSISPVTLAMTGDQFRCIAANGVPPDATSDAATLTVLSVVVPPAFATQPQSAAISPGQNASFTVAAGGTPAPTYRWQRKPAAGATWSDLTNGAVYTGVTTATLTVNGATVDMTGDQFRSIASNGVAPDATSNAAVLTVSAVPAAPLIATQPQSATVVEGLNATFAVTATGSPVPSYRWQYKPAGSSTWGDLVNALNYSGVTTSVLTVTSVTPGMTGDQFRSVAANGVPPDATSSVATLTVSALGTAPLFTTQPLGLSVSTGSSATFTAAVSGNPTPTLQWRKNGNPIVGATGATLALTAVTTADAATYSVVATNSVSSVPSDDAVLTVKLTSALRAFALRARTGGGATMLNGVFMVEGGSAKSLLVRALGPGLVQPPYVTLVDPQLQILGRDGTSIALNNNWSTAANAVVITAAAAAAGATPLASGSTDAAVLSTFAPGAYAFRASGADNAAGFVGFELLESDTVPRIVYMAARSLVGSGSEAQVAGIVVAGVGPRTFLVRAIGPSLGLPGALSDPKLEVYQGASKIGENDNWLGTTQALATQVGAAALDFSSKDAALAVTLNPGAYTLNLTGVGGATGLALLEIFEVDADRATVISPAIISQPADVTAVAGTTASFKVLTAGRPAATYQWRKDTLPLAGETNAGLTLANVQRPGHVGVYDVIVSGGGGAPITSAPATLAILPAEIVALTPSSVVSGGGDFTLTVSGSGYANTSVVRWNGAPRPTTFVNPTTLTAAIPASDIVASNSIQTVLVAVEAPGPDLSNTRALSVRPISVAAGAVQVDVARAGSSVTVTSAPSVAGGAGVTATLDNNLAGSATASIAVANYVANPSAVPYFDVGGKFSDVQAAGVDASDRATVQFYYPSTVIGSAETDLALLYFEKTSANWNPVLSSGGSAPVKNMNDNLDGTVSGGRFSVVFDNASTPKLTELTGTFFTASPRDTVAPTITLVSASPSVLSDANHAMVPVTLSVTASDTPPGLPLRSRILSVTSNDPVSGTGAGDLTPDWEITGNLTLNLRAERVAAGSGRVYTITVEVRDAAGNTATKATTVNVPAAAAGPVDVTAQLQITRTGYLLNRTTRRFVQTVTVKNVGSQPIAGPLSIVLEQLSANATLYAPAGFTAAITPAGSPYFNPNLGADGILSVGESATVTVEFTNPSNLGISYTTRAFAGEGSR